MSPTAPGNSELMRAIEGLRTEFRDLAVALREDYLRKDVYEANRSADLQQGLGMDTEIHNLTKRIDGLTEQRDKERDSLIQRMRGNNRLVATLALTAFIGPFITLWIAHAAGIR